MILKPGFPTTLHKNTAEAVKDYFLKIPQVDTVLVVNSCARGQAVPESDLDFAILIQPGTTPIEKANIESCWEIFSETQPVIPEYKQSSQFAHLHLDIIDGSYMPAILKKGEPIDYFEIEIGNQVCYSAPMDAAGPYFRKLQNTWLPYYDEKIRMERLLTAINACKYNLDHILFFMRRELYFHAFDTLYKAFQEYLQILFIANKTYPIAYNKWIKYQIVNLLNMPDLYPKLSPILSVRNFESKEIIDKAKILGELLNNLTP